jgi:hypothetical protein
MRKKVQVTYAFSDLPHPVRTAIRRYANAFENDSWKGGGDPADWPQIEQELADAKQNLIRTLLENLKKPKKKVSK